MDIDQLASYQAGYDRVADEYVRRISDELRNKPLDRELLDRFAARVRAQGPACDIGCGPGHVARYLQEQDVDVVGIDLSRAMIEHARRLTPKIDFRQGDTLSLDVPDESWAGIAASYSILHIPRGDLSQALGELRRVCSRAARCSWHFTLATFQSIWTSGGGRRCRSTSFFSNPRK